MKEIKISKFNDITGTKQEIISLEQMIEEMINPIEEFDNKIEIIKHFKNKKDDKKVEELKKKLHHYVVMGTHNGPRGSKNFNIDSYTYILPIDIDFKDDNKFDINVVFNKLKAIPSIFFIIVSPSGKGIKALFKMKDGLYDQKFHYRICKEIIYPQIQSHIKVQLDDRQAQYTQPFNYTTSDKYYLNWDAIPYHLPIELKDKEEVKPLLDENKDKNFQYIPDSMFEHYSPAVLSACQVATNKKDYYEKYKKLYQGDGITLSSYVDFENWLMKLNFEYVANFVREDMEDEIENNTIEVTEEVENTFKQKPLPRFSNFIYDNIPKILSNLTDKFDDEESKDVILLSQLTTFSSIFPEVTIQYARNTLHTNLFTLIIGKAGIGKGIIKYAVSSLDQIKKIEDISNKMLIEKYEENKKYNRQHKREKEFEEKDETPPVLKKSVIAADTSFSSLFKQVYDNDGVGLMWASEIDEMTKNKKTDWGEYSILIRKAFQNEAYPMQRDGRDLMIQKPRVGLLATGTPNQLDNYFDNKTDGYFSRHIFYSISKKFEIMPVDDLFNEFNYDNFIADTYAIDVLDIYHYFKDKNIQIKLPDNCKLKWRDFLLQLEKSILLYDDEMSGVLVRFGTSGIKIIMILTILRAFEKAMSNPLNLSIGNGILNVNEIDVDIVIDMILNTLQKHTYAIYKSINDGEEENIIDTYTDVDLFDELNDEFSRVDVMNLVKNKMGKKERTGDIIIRKLKDKNKIKSEGKKYIKI